MPRKPNREREQHFSFTGTSPDRIPKQRNVVAEICNKAATNPFVDAFEQSLGIKPHQPEQKLVFKTKIFEPKIPGDKTLLDALFNSEKFVIKYWKDNWSKDGDYNVFVVYAEIVTNEDKKEEEK